MSLSVKGFIRRWLLMTVLGLSGGIVFLLPFLQEVYYQPLADALHLGHTELGIVMSTFGFFSMIAYFPGGWIADRLSPRKLITTSLLLTGVLGLYFATFPGYTLTLIIHACWGTTISLLFWAAMIRVTRESAPSSQQGKAFGVLETTRGVGEIAASSSLLLVFAWLGSGNRALSTVIVLLSVIVVLLAVASWFVIDDQAGDAPDPGSERVGLKEVISVLKMPSVWLISIVVLTGYSAYWATFSFTPYVGDVFLMSASLAGLISVGKMWLKPGAAFVAGFVADKVGVARTTMALFVVLAVSFVGFGLTPAQPGMLALAVLNMAIASLAVFALRGIYFALLDEGGVPLALTGTAGGVVSVIGFTPDVFYPYLRGRILDSYPGVEGYQIVFYISAGLAAVGFVAAFLIYRNARRSDLVDERS